MTFTYGHFAWTELPLLSTSLTSWPHVSSSPLSLSYLSSSLLSLPDSNAQRTSHGCHHGVSIHAAARRHSHGCSSTAPCPLLANDATAQLARAWPMPATSTSRTASSGRTWPAAARAAQQLLFATYLTPSYSSLGSPWHSPSRRCLPVCSASACRLRESDGSELSSPTDSRNGVDGSVRRRGRGPRTGGVRLCGCGSRSGGWHVAPAQATIADPGAGRAVCGCLDAADDVCQARALVACEAANDGGSKRAAVRGLRLPFDDGRTEKDGGRR